MAAEHTPWHEDAGFWSDFASLAMFDETSWRRAACDVDLIEPMLAGGARVLDLCCGKGRHALEFARRGFQVTAVDRTAPYLAEGRRRASAEGLPVEFVRGDMRDYCRPEAFDAVVNLSTSFGFFDDPGDDTRVARNMHRSLRPGGLSVIDLVGKEVLARDMVKRDWHERAGALLLVRRAVRDGWQRVDEQWTVVRGTERRQFTMSYRPYAATELSALLQRAGFGDVSIAGDLSGAPYDTSARRLVALARK
jgi:SAM-dependent methyltransferase